MTEAAGPTKRSNETPMSASHKHQNMWIILERPAFDWKAQNKYNELLNSETEVKNIFMTKSYDIIDSESTNNYELVRTWSTPFHIH